MSVGAVPHGEDAQFVVHKATRTYKGGPGYAGPSWERAGLPIPTVPFDSWDKAKAAAEALDKVNGVGWVIAAYLGGTDG